MMTDEQCNDYFKELTLIEKNAVAHMVARLREAKKQHPKFSHGSLAYAASIVAEEAGEYVRATNRFLYRTGAYHEMIDESAQVGATAIRALCLLVRKQKDAWKLSRNKLRNDEEDQNGKEIKA